MGVEHTLSCHDCFEFIDTSKWPLILNYERYYPRGFEGQKTDIDEVGNGTKYLSQSERFSHWSVHVVPLLAEFTEKHKGHDLRIHDNSGDHPWDPEYPGYCKWKEVKGYFTLEMYLPRNLVEDLKIINWEEAITYLKKLEIYLYDELEIEEYKKVFGELVKNV